MSKYRNVFKDKDDKELKMLYGQYLEWERTGVIGKELGEICNLYYKWLDSNPLDMMQYHLLHAIADLWY